MSNAEYLSRPFPLLAKLAAALRNIAPVRKAFVRLATLLRGGKKSDEPLFSEFVGEIPDIAGEIPGIIDEVPAITDKIPGVAAEPPDAGDEADAGVTDDVTEVVDETPGVADEATDEADTGVSDVVPAHTAETSEVTEETPRAADDAPDTTDEAPAGVPDDVSGAADGAPEVTHEAPAISHEPPDGSEASEPPVMVPAASAEAPLAPACPLSTREQLIQRRWAETGIKMWAGQGALNIQGSAELLPLQPGATRREYDRLEFRLIAGDIVCEGVVVDPPSHRK